MVSLRKERKICCDLLRKQVDQWLKTGRGLRAAEHRAQSSTQNDKTKQAPNVCLDNVIVMSN